ncbi:LysR family transcriptional regulator [Streptomyces coffeae]|uniref:LysR family transcriptional regulator n=1 Tax=Streptomyces coffeae TaxID=621382 RepID=A0ABS1NBG2_9ACTN|nr:LysR family transcriptional regulator [Streptomyces coffeae]MBL1097398.1 LysR family transcriptional regulator [Streptomyces coffeae]
MTHRADLVPLRSFLTIYRTGGVAKAADALNLSQPAVSRHLKSIEETVGRPLFVRAGRGIAPTEAGHILAAEVAGHVDALENAVEVFRSGGDSDAGPVFVGGPGDILAGHVMPRLTPLLAMGMTVHCRIGLSPDLATALLRDELDVAVITKIEGAPTKQLFLRHAHDEEFVLVGRSGEKPYTPRSERRFVGYSQGMPMARRYFRSCWGIAPPQPSLTVADMRAVVVAVAAGAGLSVVPRYVAREGIDAGTLSVLHTPEEPVINPIYLAARRGKEHLPTVRAVFAQLTDAHENAVSAHNS